jgi:branched-chain amino acid transport system ATP-binding protein
MGPNGAGKTTCFNVLTGRYRPTRGHVLFRGHDITGQSPSRIARLGIARSFQLLNLFNDFTAEENVLVALPGLRDHGMNMARDVMADAGLRAQARAVLERVGLGHRADVQVRQLSYGDRRALEIGVALAADPAVLFLDEPTSGLGADAIGRLADLVRRLKGEVTIVAIEHDMEFLFGLADTIAVIHWGQVIRHGTPDELRADPWVRNSNLGRLK